MPSLVVACPYGHHYLASKTPIGLAQALDDHFSVFHGGESWDFLRSHTARWDRAADIVNQMLRIRRLDHLEEVSHCA